MRPPPYHRLAHGGGKPLKRVSLQITYCCDQLQPCAYCPLGVVLVRMGAAEVDQHPVAHELRDETAEATHSLSDALSRARTSPGAAQAENAGGADGTSRLLKPLHDQQTLGAQPDQREGARQAQPAQHQTLTQARYCGIAMSDFNGRKIGECRAAITAFRNRAAGVMSSQHRDLLSALQPELREPYQRGIQPAG